MNEGKHKEARCQRDFVCKHRSHERYPTKKHVLICGEHKGDQQNQDVSSTTNLDVSWNTPYQHLRRKTKYSMHCQGRRPHTEPNPWLKWSNIHATNNHHQWSKLHHFFMIPAAVTSSVDRKQFSFLARTHIKSLLGKFRWEVLAAQQVSPSTEHLPNAASMVGGEVDLMIGIKYLWYFPQLIFHMPSWYSISPIFPTATVPAQ